jgi:hypothetical protein
MLDTKRKFVVGKYLGRVIFFPLTNEYFQYYQVLWTMWKIFVQFWVCTIYVRNIDMTSMCGILISVSIKMDFAILERCFSIFFHL